MSVEHDDHARWYTKSRRIPILIGKTLDGTRIPGGPFTQTQLAAGVLAAPLLWFTMPLWNLGSFFINLGALLAGIYGAVVLAGRLPIGMRNPLSIAWTGARAWTAPTGGKINGRPVRNRKPIRLSGWSRAQVQPLHPAFQNTCAPAPVSEPLPVVEVVTTVQVKKTQPATSVSYAQQLLIGKV